MLEFKLLPKQKEFIKAKESTLFVAGYGSGKSYAGTVKTIIKKLMYPQQAVAYYLPTYGLIRDIAFEKFPTILEELKLKYKINKSDKEIHIENYGKIIFRSMDTPETIIGYEVAYSLIDEADTLPTDKMKLVYEKILGRNRAVDNATVDAVSTPEGFKWLYQQSINGLFRVIHSSTTDNKFISQSYIDNLKAQYTPELLEAYLEGHFVNLTQSTVYSYFKREEHNTTEELKDNEIVYIGQDFNIGGCCSVVFSLRDDKVFIVDEFSSRDTRGIVENIVSRYPNRKIVIYPDASGYAHKTNASLSDNDILREAGFKINAPRMNGRVKDRVNTVNNLFSKNKMFINIKRCPQLTKALEQQAYDKNGEPEKFTGSATVDDWNDAMGYFIAREFHKGHNAELRATTR